MTLISVPIPLKPRILKFHKPILNVSQTPFENKIWELMANNLNLFYMSKGFRAGLCIPSTCSTQELQTIANQCMKFFYQFFSFISFFNELFNYRIIAYFIESLNKFRITDIIFCLLFGFFLNSITDP
jgi:hypothetical protein